MGLCVIVIYAFVSFVINYWITVTSTNNTFLYEAFTFLEFVLFSGFLYTQIQNKKAKYFLVLATIAFTIFFLAYSFLLKAVKGIDSIPIGVETIIILIFSFYFLYERMNDTTTLFIYNKYPFWVVLGIVLYLAGSFFIYIFASYLRNDDDIRKYWVITNIFSILKNIFFTAAVYIHVKQFNKPKPHKSSPENLN